MSAKVSIIIRTKNRPKLLLEAVHSVYLQTYPNVEAVIINDGGQSVSEILLPFKDKLPIKLVELNPGKGRSAAANIGIAQSDGELIGFLDDDDLLYPQHIRELAELISSDYPIAYSDALKAIRGSNNNLIDFFLDYSSNGDFKEMLKANFIPIQCLLFQRKVFNQEKFDETLNVLEDWDLFIRLMYKYKFKHLRRITSEYSFRLNQSNTSGQNTGLWLETANLINQRYKEYHG